MEHMNVIVACTLSHMKVIDEIYMISGACLIPLSFRKIVNVLVTGNGY